MIVIKNKTISADLETILKELKQYVQARDGKVILKDIKDVGDNIMITCPFHKDGDERRPSCGVSNIDKEETPAGTVHCFTCGATMFIDKLVSYLLNFDDSGEEGRKWLLSNFDISHNRKIEIKIDKDCRLKKEVNKDIISEALLKEYRFYHPYMFKRGLTEEIIEKYDIGYDKYSDTITFPIRDVCGDCVFLAKRSVKGKMFILPSGLNKPLYGIYELDYSKPDTFIVESFFNALTLAKWGYNAIAMMGTGSSSQYKLINQLPFRTIRICLDGDLAGKLGTKKLFNNISKNKIVYSHNMIDGKDVNDLTEEEFNNLIVEMRK